MKGKPFKYLLALGLFSVLFLFSCQNDDINSSVVDIPTYSGKEYVFANEKIQMKSSPTGRLLSYLKVDRGVRSLWVASATTLEELKITEELPIEMFDWTFDNHLIVSTKGEKSARLIKIDPADKSHIELNIPTASIVRMIGKSRHFPDQVAALVMATDQSESGIYRVYLNGIQRAEKIADLEDFDSIYFDLPNKIKVDKRMADQPREQA